MRYNIIAAVPPTRPFPIASLGLPDVKSLDDAKSKLQAKHTSDAAAEIEAHVVSQDLAYADSQIEAAKTAREAAFKAMTTMDSKEKIEADTEAVISKFQEDIKVITEHLKRISERVKEKHGGLYTSEAKLLEERWPSVEPALAQHLARQERRAAHWNMSCRITTCQNPSPTRKGGSGIRATKARRSSIHPFFCRLHKGVRRLLTASQLAELYRGVAKRVVAV